MRCLDSFAVLLQRMACHVPHKRWWFLIVAFSICVIHDSREENRDIVTSLYVIVQLMTTVGYGDITPKHNMTRLVTVLFILFSLVFVAHFLNEMVSSTMERLKSAMHKKLLANVESPQSGLRRSITAPIVNWSDATKQVMFASALFGGFVLFGTVFYAIYESCSCSYEQTFVAGCEEKSYDRCIETGGKQKTLFLSFYMSIVTLTTVGFGDVTPSTMLGRLIGLPWMIFGVAASGLFVASLSAYFFEQAQHEKMAAAFEVSDVLLDKIDTDREGVMSKAEHHLFYLRANGIVDEDILGQLDTHFDKLSGDGNLVDVARLREASAMRRTSLNRISSRSSRRSSREVQAEMMLHGGIGGPQPGASVLMGE